MGKKMKKSQFGRHRPNKYADLKPSEQQHTSGQRRVQRQRERQAPPEK